MPSVKDVLQSRMDYLVARQGVISQNIANADTPGYLSRDTVDPANTKTQGTFAMVLSRQGHISGQSGTGSRYATTTDTTYLQHNGNSVRLDNEMLKMNQTQLEYRAMADLYAKYRQLGSIALRGQ